jgi:molybdopterin converting factor small subunit
MAITVLFPAMLQPTVGTEILIDEPISDIAGLLAVLEHRIPGISALLSDPIFNVAVNDEMLLHGVRQHPLKDGDVVEIVPTISGG